MVVLICQSSTHTQTCACAFYSARMFSHMRSVCSAEMRGLSTDVCLQEVRHFLLNPLFFCPNTFLLSFPFFLFPFFLFPGIGSVCFYCICLISSFTSRFHSCSRPASSFTGSVTEGKLRMKPPHCVPFDRASLPILHQTPKGGQHALFAFWSSNKLVAKENKRIRQPNLAGLRTGKEELHACYSSRVFFCCVSLCCCKGNIKHQNCQTCWRGSLVALATGVISNCFSDLWMANCFAFLIVGNYA